MRPIVIVMAKAPRAGETKTRLCPPLTAQQAAGLYSALLADTLEFVLHLQDVQPAVAVTPPDGITYFLECVRHGVRLYPVAGRDIGEVLHRVLATAFGEGYPKAIAIHSDGPTFPPGVVGQAMTALDAHDVVLGPCDDGGYYLVGLKRACAPLFEGIEWSTPRVISQTIARAEQLGLATYLLPAASDVDTADDLARLAGWLSRDGQGRMPHTRAFLSA